MNYIWYPYIKAIQSGFDTTKINYNVKDKEYYYNAGDEQFIYNADPHRASPFFEYMPVVLSVTEEAVTPEEKFSSVDVNPYYRFDAIFSHILQPDRNDPNDLIICDIIMHMLADVDRICGMSKNDFRLMLMVEEIENGCFNDTNDTFKLFNTTEKRILAEGLTMLYKTSNSLRSLDVLLKRIMPDFSIGIRGNEEVVFYNSYKFNEHEEKKLQFIIKLFLPINFAYVIHWRYTYGVIGYDQSMVLEGFVL